MSTTVLGPTYHSVLRKVVMGCPNPYAKAYARSGLSITNIDDQKTNALYVLSNLNFWRGVEAQECRNFLRSFTGTK